MAYNRQELKEWLKKLHHASKDELPKIKEGLAKYIKKIDPSELALAEQELIQEGLGRQELKRLCDVHLEVMKDKLGVQGPKVKLASSHPIQICKDEHKVIKRNLKRLKATLEKLRKSGSIEKGRRQINTLKELAHFFLETDKHHRREEEALFPRLEAHGIVEPPQIFKEDHVEFMAKKKEFYGIIMSEPKDYSEFLHRIGSIIDFLAQNLADHIYKEDNILYPMALKALDKEEWPMVRKKFDAIGYCCFAPADVVKKEKRNVKEKNHQD